MGKAELGTKCTCAGCGERFYDLNKSPQICPKCGAEQPPEKPRMVRPPPRGTFGTRFRAPPPAAAVATEEDAGPAEAESGDDAVEAEDDADDADDADDDIEAEAGIVKTDD